MTLVSIAFYWLSMMKVVFKRVMENAYYENSHSLNIFFVPKHTLSPFFPHELFDDPAGVVAWESCILALVSFLQFILCVSLGIVSQSHFLMEMILIWIS